MAERPVRALRDRVQLVPNMTGLNDKSATEPVSRNEEEALAQMALLSNVPVSDAQITTFLRYVSNSTLTASVQQAQ